ncbi:MAG TPA: flagellar biosynthesis protein FliQ [Gemmatimonadales bacterium]
MTPLLASDLLQRTLTLVVTVAGPMLLAALVIGIAVSLLQAVTQIQEQSLTFIPKLVVVALVFMLSLPWMMRLLVEFTVGMFRSLPSVAR